MKLAGHLCFAPDKNKENFINLNNLVCQFVNSILNKPDEENRESQQVNMECFLYPRTSCLTVPLNPRLRLLPLSPLPPPTTLSLHSLPPSSEPQTVHPTPTHPSPKHSLLTLLSLTPPYIWYNKLQTTN